MYECNEEEWRRGEGCFPREGLVAGGWSGGSVWRANGSEEHCPGGLHTPGRGSNRPAGLHASGDRGIGGEEEVCGGAHVPVHAELVYPLCGRGGDADADGRSVQCGAAEGLRGVAGEGERAELEHGVDVYADAEGSVQPDFAAGKRGARPEAVCRRTYEGGVEDEAGTDGAAGTCADECRLCDVAGGAAPRAGLFLADVPLPGDAVHRPGALAEKGCARGRDRLPTAQDGAADNGEDTEGGRAADEEVPGDGGRVGLPVPDTAGSEGGGQGALPELSAGAEGVQQGIGEAGGGVAAGDEDQFVHRPAYVGDVSLLSGHAGGDHQ